MSFVNRAGLSVCIVSSVLLTSACSDDQAAEIVEQLDLEPVESDVSIQMAAQVNGADFTCGQTYTGVGTGGDDFKVNDFRLYVHDVLVRDGLTGEDYPVELTQDGVWQYENVALLDFEDGCASGTVETNNVVTGKVTVPVTVDLAATEVCFTVGVPVDKNHLDVNDINAVTSPLNDSTMYWAWKIGYKYVRIDGVGDPTGDTPNPFVLHLGAQGCPMTGDMTAPPESECTVPNTFQACIANFDIENDVIAVDPAFVFEANDVMAVNGAKPGCMSFVDDDDCEEIMPRLGLDYAYGRSLTGVESTYDGGQRLFSKQ
jgi:uncharacterized repeat protein (TIGR04052 family)